MKTDFNFPNKDLVGAVIFRPSFNDHTEVIDANQAWSLFFTAGREDKALGFNGEAGRFFTNLLVAMGAAGALWPVLFHPVV